ncbi:hypothetical protein H0A36_27390 [Endozoicomonas sp. SM1973]|uniref:Uncharacterized protein n=1 Tax=Spartinivicinus marinus TaxID=2994442 RepID=A0A853I748_9GAMM|nr:hypothetical protein [Spartinivicinus marinus]MCX4025085.1 hypothetical protein [Spartinivicinus marinus]NYZ69740.1 hypothetical protein [Spartinivicinus marinus]
MKKWRPRECVIRIDMKHDYDLMKAFGRAYAVGQMEVAASIANQAISKMMASVKNNSN